MEPLVIAPTGQSDWIGPEATCTNTRGSGEPYTGPRAADSLVAATL